MADFSPLEAQYRSRYEICGRKPTELNPQPLTDAAIVPSTPLGAVSPEGTPTVEPCAPGLYLENIGLAEKSAPNKQPHRMILRFPPLTARILRYLLLGGVGYESFALRSCRGK